MDKRLGSLARFAEVAGVYRTESIMVEDSWYQQGEALPVMVQYDGAYRNGLIRFSPHLDEVDVDGPRGCMTLRGNEFLSVLVWLIRQGLLENVGLVSTETGMDPRVREGDGRGAEEEGPHNCLCAVEPAREAERIQAITDWGIEQERARMDPRFHGGDVAGGEEEPAGPFLVQLVEGAGEPNWLEDAHIMRHLHHTLELSASDIAKLCNTTYARVKGALKRHRIEQRSYRGGRSKIDPRSAPEYTVR